MDPRLLRIYNEELAYLRESAREFGEEHPKVAGRLGLDTPTDADPYVERILEGSAFLSARVRLKIADQFPDFTQHLLNAVQPAYLAPTPSMCIVAMEPGEADPIPPEGYRIPRGSALHARFADQSGSMVTFRTGHAMTLYPLEVTACDYLATRAAVGPYAAAAGVNAQAGLRFRLGGIGGASITQVSAESLPVYLDGAEHVPGELYRQCIGDAVAVIARDPDATAMDNWVRLPLPRQHGFSEDCALLPAERRAFRGYRLLSEYFACPERFLFVELTELARAFAGCQTRCEIVVLFSRAAPNLAGSLTPANLKLFCTPAINLFEKQLDRVQIRDTDHEKQVMPDRTRPLDYEVWRILEVKAHDLGEQEARPVAPLHAFGTLLYDWRSALFFVTRMVPRRLSTREQKRRRRTDYVGTDTWISVTSPGDPAGMRNLQELSVRALVTNRELPELLRFGAQSSDFELDMGAPVKSIRVVRAPTRPRPPMGLGAAAWRVIGHLTPNYTSLAPEDDADPSLLRDHLALYGRTEDPAVRRQIDGVLSVQSERVTRRIPGARRLAFGRGRRIRLQLDDAAFENARIFLFSAVVERFLAEFASINSFTECVFETKDMGVFVQWPTRVGERPTI